MKNKNVPFANMRRKQIIKKGRIKAKKKKHKKWLSLKAVRCSFFPLFWVCCNLEFCHRKEKNDGPIYKNLFETGIDMKL